jgi:carboxypeptidase T
MRQLYSILFFLIFMGLHLSAQENYQRLKVDMQGHSIFELLQMGLAIDHANFREGYLMHDFAPTEVELLQAAGFSYEVLIDDVSTYYASQNEKESGLPLKNACGGNTVNGPAFPIPQNFATGSMAGFLTYQEMLDQLDSMRAKYPQLISARAVINPNDLTHEGRPIFWLRISDNPDVDEAEPEALFNALHHSREPLSLSQLIYFMWYLLENYDTDPNIKTLVDQTELYFVPCINPDGYIYNETTNPNGGGMWRKNRRNNGNGTYGVDLNRNYGYQWGYDNNGSSPDPQSLTYRGPSGFSEPETRNIRDFCQQHNFTFALNYHSYGNLLVYPWAYNGIETADSSYYRDFGNLMTQFNNYVTGTGTQTVGYNSNGDADDWLYGEQQTKNKILSMTPEAGPSSYGFWPPANTIQPLCHDLLWQNLNMAYFLLNYGVAKDKSDPIIGQQINPITFELKRYGFANGSLTLSLDPISTNIDGVGAAKTFNLSQLQLVEDSINLVVSMSAQTGDLIRFAFVVDNGQGLVFRDTVEKVYGAYSLALSDPALNLNNWANLGTNSNWELTTFDFHSAPSSITDSKTGDYPNNSSSELILTQALDLRNAVDASLTFWAQWSIEDNYDYAQILASDDQGVFSPLCGLYTEDGSAFQDENQPVYDGAQAFWVQEQISLNDYLGDSAVVLKFSLQADQWVRDDGFYFDDLEVNYLSGVVISGQEGLRRNFVRLGQSQPNPANERLFIPIDWPTENNTKNLRLRVYNLLGQLMADLPVSTASNGLELEVGDWPQGSYSYQLVGENWQSEPKKLQLAR